MGEINDYVSEEIIKLQMDSWYRRRVIGITLSTWWISYKKILTARLVADHTGEEQVFDVSTDEVHEKLTRNGKKETQDELSESDPEDIPNVVKYKRNISVEIQMIISLK